MNPACGIPVEILKTAGGKQYKGLLIVRRDVRDKGAIVAENG
jgi:hypothetical protein